MTAKKNIRLVNWERFQHYKHRNPPWIKLYCEMLSSQTWVTLDDSNRVLAFAVLMLAARHDNKIPMDPAYIRRVAYLNSDPDFASLLGINFIEIVEDASNMLAPCEHDASNLHQNALPETEKRQSREETENSSSEPKSSSDQEKTSNNFRLEENATPTPKATPSHEAQKLAALLSGEIRRNAPEFRITPSQLRKWAVTADRMLRLDRRSYDQTVDVIRWCQADEFWHSNVLSMEKVREKFDTLVLKGELHQRQRQPIVPAADPTQEVAVCGTCGGAKMLLQPSHVPGPRLVRCPECNPAGAIPPSGIDRNPDPRKPAQASPYRHHATGVETWSPQS
jgi:hypothetical protein